MSATVTVAHVDAKGRMDHSSAPELLQSVRAVGVGVSYCVRYSSAGFGNSTLSQ